MVKNQDLFAIGKEYTEIDFEGWLDWFIQFGDLSYHWKIQPSYVLSHSVFLLGGFLTFIHAFKTGGKLPYLWLATILHGFVVECMSYAVPDIDNFWHSQTPIMFLGRRLPIHIIFLYPCFIYQASVGVEKLKLRSWAKPFAVGLATVLIDIPYDIVSVNYLHWTWHDTDPNIADRHYWVPWNSYYFHACFAASFTFWFDLTAKLCAKSKNVDKWESTGFKTNIISTIAAGLLGTPGGILLFIPLYHPLHDSHKIHSEVTFFVLFTVFLLIIWSGDRLTKKDTNNSLVAKNKWILLCHLIPHYLTFLTILIGFKPEAEIAVGLKEPIGNCNEYSPVNTAFGMVLRKRKFLCASDYDEKYFDWKCLPGEKPPKDGAIWYTACAVPLPNKVEFLVIISTIILIASVVFGHMHFGDSKTISKNNTKTKESKKRV